MGFIGFLGFAGVLWVLYLLMKSMNESVGQQKQIIEELRLLRRVAERLEDTQAQTEVVSVHHLERREADIESTKDDERIDINLADIDALQGLPGVGKVLAQKIIAERPYKTTDDLLKVSGISQDVLTRLKSSIKA